MSSNHVSKQAVREDAPSRSSGAVESHEESAKASASAGLNLNVFGALSGVFSGSTKKETAPDGSSTEQREERAAMKGAGAGNLQANGSADAEENKKSSRGRIEGK